MVEVLAAAAAVALVYDGAFTGQTRTFAGIELALFAVALFLTACLGGAGKVLAIGGGLGLAFATLLAMGASDFFSPGDLFMIGVIVAAAFYPGCALGVGLGALVRSISAGRSNR
jgi:hypothetical protein